MQAKVKTNMRFLFPHKFATDIFSVLKLERGFSDLNTTTKETSVFQKARNYATEELPHNFQF